MAYRNSEFYEDKTVFEKYIHQRRQSNNLNDAIEMPVLKELIGDVEGKNVLDLGCGDGEIGSYLLERGCKHYTGVDGSSRMIGFAKENFKDIDNAHFEQALLQEWNFPVSQFDLVISRMSLHYLSDLSKVFNQVYDSLKTGGTFVFSVEHPFFTYLHYSKDYYETGEKTCNWLGNQVIKNHRTLEDYVRVIQEAGFNLSSLRESKPHELLDEEEKQMPLVLFIKGNKG